MLPNEIETRRMLTVWRRQYRDCRPIDGCSTARWICTEHKTTRSQLLEWPTVT